jgi:hypothetical protein
MMNEPFQDSRRELKCLLEENASMNVPRGRKRRKYEKLWKINVTPSISRQDCNKICKTQGRLEAS